MAEVPNNKLDLHEALFRTSAYSKSSASLYGNDKWTIRQEKIENKDFTQPF